MNLRMIKTNNKSQKVREFFYDLHRRYWNRNRTHGIAYDILVGRLGAISVWIAVILIELFAYNHTNKKYTTIFNFLFGFSNQIKNLISISYAAGAAAYGASIEIYFLIPLVVINSILAIENCGIDHCAVRETLLFALATIALLLGTELSHQNFKRFTFQQSYQLHYQKATRAMLRPSIYLSVTMMFLASPGLRAIYNAARLKCPYAHELSTNTSSCKLIDRSRPAFEENDPCVPDFAAMMASFEQLRVIRDIAICSIAFYSMYNRAFLDITGIVSITHKLIIHLFFAMTLSVIVVSVDPFKFTEYEIYFKAIEITMFLFIMILLVFNLRKSCKHRRGIIMEPNPTIFG